MKRRYDVPFAKLEIGVFNMGDDIVAPISTKQNTNKINIYPATCI